LEINNNTWEFQNFVKFGQQTSLYIQLPIKWNSM
jgi:hypothetical protein